MQSCGLFGTNARQGSQVINACADHGFDAVEMLPQQPGRFGANSEKLVQEERGKSYVSYLFLLFRNPIPKSATIFCNAASFTCMIRAT